MPDTPFLIGAALTAPWLDTYRGWLREAPRDLEIQDFFRADVLDGDWRSLADDIRRKLDGREGRLGIHGPFWGFAVDTQDPLVRDVVKKRMDQGLDVCGVLGATQMVVHSPVTTWDHNNFDNNENAREAQADRVRACLGDALARAESMGVTLVMENIQDVDPDARALIAEIIGSPALKLSIDTGHAHYAHGSTGAPPVDYYVARAGTALHHIHLQDADGYADRHWAIGTGTIRWHAVFQALRESRATPHLVLELRDPAEIPRSMAFLEEQGLGR